MVSTWFRNAFKKRWKKQWKNDGKSDAKMMLKGIQKGPQSDCKATPKCLPKGPQSECNATATWSRRDPGVNAKWHRSDPNVKPMPPFRPLFDIFLISCWRIFVDFHSFSEARLLFRSSSFSFSLPLLLSSFVAFPLLSVAVPSHPEI